MIDAYLASEEFKPTVLAESTRRSYKLYLGHARLALGQHPPSSIRPSHIIALRDQFAETPVAANTIVAALRTVYKWGILRDHASNNPCAGVPKLQGGKEHQPWPVEAIEAVVANARWEVRRFVLLTLYTGQREGDVCRMSLRDVEDNMIRVIQEKTGKELWIPIHRELRPVIEECRQAGTIAILPRGNGEPFDANNFRAMWGREMKKPALAIVKRLGLVPHGLCKNAHNLLFEAGNSNKEVQSVTGRSAPMIAHYSKGVDQKKLAKRAVERSEEAK
jgi:integrase